MKETVEVLDNRGSAFALTVGKEGREVKIDLRGVRRAVWFSPNGARALALSLIEVANSLDPSGAHVFDEARAAAADTKA